MGWTRDLGNISYPSLTTPTPFKSQKILCKTEHRVQIYFNQKEIKYIPHSNIIASVETRPESYTICSNSLPSSIADILWTSPTRFASFCDTSISSKY